MLLLCLNISILAKGQLLETKLTVSYREMTLEKILWDLRKNYGINISYSSNLIPTKKKYSFSQKDESLKNILTLLFKDSEVVYKVVGNQIVLTKDPNKSKPQVKKATSAGSLQQRSTEEVKEIEMLSASLGSPLDLTLDRLELRRDFQIEKKRLQDSYEVKADSLKLTSTKQSVAELKQKMKVLMRGFKQDLQNLRDSLEHSPRFKRNTDSVEVRRASDTAYLHRDWQVTFVPPLGSNGLETGKVVNKFSFNVLGGYSAGLEGAELAGIANIEKSHVRGVQLAGIGNIVNNEMQGAQFAGIVNIVNGYAMGGQFAGIANIVADSSVAFQAAGITNTVGGNSYGGQFAGITNLVKGNLIGPQGAGIVNVAGGEVNGVQIAGIANLAGGKMRGVQVAGIANTSAKEIVGVQIAGIVNAAKKVKGSQIGLLNIADSVSGVQIGLLSIARNGYRRLEIYGGEALYGNIAFKMGTRHFYNIFAGGLSWRDQKGSLDFGLPTKDSYVQWALGYGIGTELTLTSKTRLNIDLLSYHINEGKEWTTKLNLLNQARMQFGFLIGKKTSLFLGPVFNIKVSQVANEDGTIGSKMASWNVYNKTQNKTNVTMWPGLHAGIRF
jgi:hypothetical protein